MMYFLLEDTVLFLIFKIGLLVTFTLYVYVFSLHFAEITVLPFFNATIFPSDDTEAIFGFEEE